MRDGDNENGHVDGDKEEAGHPIRVTRFHLLWS